MKIKFILLAFIFFDLIGCKKTYEDTFEYKILDQKICAIKSKAIENANKINWLFPEVRNFNGEVISENLKFDKDDKNYLFCYNLDEFKKEVGRGPIQSDISIEIDLTSSVQECNLRNYSCILNNRIKLNISKTELAEICI
ncbi:MAG: hypothetical protein GAK29_03156 [Acinetobacter bereziniae]|uniref:Uncharacterized protein n=1 Tax=Acinetobacter bereziniae TaxID=106648 RepID=A0A833UBE1_ACIBZ|nr:MAG: hypothetical protein GAK29_03156 [Acinetobacter bereziniae]